jgi:hypothetical protein
MTNPVPNPQPVAPESNNRANRAANPPSEQARIDFDIVDAHRALATLGLHYTRLSRQFQKALDQLREIQSERAERERRDPRDAASLLEFHKHKGVLWEPYKLFSEDGFVFSKERVEAFAQHVCFHMPPTRSASEV